MKCTAPCIIYTRRIDQKKKWWVVIICIHLFSAAARKGWCYKVIQPGDKKGVIVQNIRCLNCVFVIKPCIFPFIFSLNIPPGSQVISLPVSSITGFPVWGFLPCLHILLWNWIFRALTLGCRRHFKTVFQNMHNAFKGFMGLRFTKIGRRWMNLANDFSSGEGYRGVWRGNRFKF